MDFKRVELYPEDDIVSIGDRLDWLVAGAEANRVLLVLPEQGDVLRNGLDLVRLRRHADRLRVEVGLVTADSDLTRQARALGIPTFTSEETAASHRRGWWRGRKRSEQVGLFPFGDGDYSPAQRPLAQWQQEARPGTNRRRWAVRYAAIVLFYLTLALGYVAFLYLVPVASLTLQPRVEPVAATQQVIVDPGLTAVDYANGAAPGRALLVEKEQEATLATTGEVEIPNTPARGEVIFTNQTEESVAVGAGTPLLTNDGLVFHTLETAVLPAVEDSTAAVPVIADAPGPQGNVPANAIVQVEDEELDEQVTVTNPAALVGGAVEAVAAVAEADQRRVRAQALQFLQAVALAEMEAQLTEREFIAPESLQVADVLTETYSHAVGEQTDHLSLRLRVRMQGTAVDTTLTSGLIYNRLAAQAPNGYTLLPDSIEVEPEAVLGLDSQGRMTLATAGRGLAAADLELADRLEAIAGQDPETAVAYLYENLPLRDVPRLQVWPTWFDRVPYRVGRIQIDIQAEEASVSARRGE